MQEDAEMPSVTRCPAQAPGAFLSFPASSPSHSAGCWALPEVGLVSSRAKPRWGSWHAQTMTRARPQALLVWLQVKQVLNLGLSRFTAVMWYCSLTWHCSSVWYCSSLSLQNTAEKSKGDIKRGRVKAQVKQLDEAGTSPLMNGTSVPLFQIIHSYRGMYQIFLFFHSTISLLTRNHEAAQSSCPFSCCISVYYVYREKENHCKE